MNIPRGVRGVATTLAAVAAFGPPTPALAQARAPGADGIEAFRSLDFETSVTSLRAVLASANATRLGDSIQAALLTYIGAAEYLLNRRGEAMRTFRSALEHAPDSRPDTLVFPPAITTAFEEARRGTALVVARAAGASAFAAGRGRIDFRLEASAPHVVRVSIQDARGVVIRTLFDGPITDTLWVAWDGLLSSGAAVAAGRTAFCVTSIDSDGIARTLKMPLEVERLDVAIRASAPDSARPVASAAGATAAITSARVSRWQRLVTGALAAVAVVALPQAMSARPEPSSRRFVVGGVLVAASVLAFRDPGRGPSQSESVVRPPARLMPTAPPSEMPKPAVSDATARVRISPLATRARSER